MCKWILVQLLASTCYFLFLLHHLSFLHLASIHNTAIHMTSSCTLDVQVYMDISIPPSTHTHTNTHTHQWRSQDTEVARAQELHAGEGST